MRITLATAIAMIALVPAIADARELARVERIDASTVELTRDDTAPIQIWLSQDTIADSSDKLVVESTKAKKVRLAVPATTRTFVILRGADGSTVVEAERRLPLQQASNFRDIGGYVTKDGQTVKWGKAFRSGAMPLLTEADYAYINQLGLGAVVDLRSLEERTVTDDKVDDRTGVLFLSNDYSMKTLFAKMRDSNGENMYKGMEVLLIPQFRALYSRIMADEGAVLYHCSAGQDRTGIATALLYDMLGVDRETILKDYHLSTAWRNPKWEMPAINPKDYPDNPLVQMYASMPEEQRNKAQPLYTPDGASHLAQFFTYLDATYGGSEQYMKKELGFTDAQIAKLRSVMLD